MASKKRDPIKVAEWQRNGRERIRISLEQYCGRDLCRFGLFGRAKTARNMLAGMASP